MEPHLKSGEGAEVHVLQIAGNAIVGGMEKYIYNLVQNLPSSRFRVTCLTPYESAYTASLRQLGCDVYITPMDDNPPWRSIQFTVELIRHLRVDILHAHLPRAHVLAGLAGSLTSTPVIATIHGMDISAHELGISLTTGTHLTLVCQSAHTQALALGMSPKRVTLIPNGVNTNIYTPSRGDGRFRQSLGIPARAPLLGFVGRLAWEKGPDQFVLVAEQVHKHNSEAHFVLIGEGPMERELVEQIRDINGQAYIHLAGMRDETWKIYPELDLLLMTSRVEGMPFALLEAMSCGLPIAAMNVGGIAEIIEVGTTGLMSAEGDWWGMADGLVSLLSNPERMKSMGKAARQRVETYFDWRDSVRRMAGLYYRQLGKKAPKEELWPAHEWPLVEEDQERSSVPIDPEELFKKRK